MSATTTTDTTSTSTAGPGSRSLPIRARGDDERTGCAHSNAEPCWPLSCGGRGGCGCMASGGGCGRFVHGSGVHVMTKLRRARSGRKGVL